MTQLLVSVRSTAEAESALVGGADWIDIKEPRRGSLGRADERTIADIMTFVAGRRPVSAALGEWSTTPVEDSGRATLPKRATLPLPHPCPGFVKIGLADTANRNWRDGLRSLQRALANRCAASLIPAAYADWRRASAPPAGDVLQFAIDEGCPGFLIDTWQKDGTTLLDWCALGELAGWCELAHKHGLFVALAGSLKEADLAKVLPLRPDVIAVRGAVCRGGRRDAQLDPELVQRLAAFVHSSSLKQTTRTLASLAATRGNHSSTIPLPASSSTEASGTGQDLSRINSFAPAR